MPGVFLKLSELSGVSSGSGVAIDLNGNLEEMRCKTVVNFWPGAHRLSCYVFWFSHVYAECNNDPPTGFFLHMLFFCTYVHINSSTVLALQCKDKNKNKKA